MNTFFSASIYLDLLTILGEKGLLVKQHKRPPLVRQDSICLSPRKGLPRDPHTGKGIYLLINKCFFMKTLLFMVINLF